MNAFAKAASYGFSADQILKFFMKQDPAIAGRIEKALAMGYSADAIIKFLSKQMPGESKAPKGAPDTRIGRAFDPSVANAERAKRGRSALTNLLDPNRLLTMAASAGIGAMVGGPAGAVAGAAGGMSAYNDLLNRYENHVRSGGDLSLGDFFKAAAKGVGAAGTAYMGAKAMGMTGRGAAAATAAETLKPEPGDIDITPGGPAPGGAPQLPQLPGKPGGGAGGAVAPAMAAAGVAIDSGKARDLLKKGGMLVALGTLSRTMDPADAAEALRTLHGKRKTGMLEKAAGVPLEEIVTAAFPTEGDPIPQRQLGAQQPQPEVTSTGLEPQQELTPPPAEIAETTTEEVTQRPFQEFTNEAIQNTYRQAMPKKKPIDPKRLMHIQALPSSNLRALHYDANDQTLQVMFGSGQAYNIPDVPYDVAAKIAAGSPNEVVTEGDGMSFRAFSKGKVGSIQKAYNEQIKAFPERFKAEKIDEPAVRDKGMRAVKKADRIHEASEAFDKFHGIRERARASSQLMESKELQEVTDGMSEENIMDLLLELRHGLQQYSKKRRAEDKRGKPATASNLAVEVAARRGLPERKTAKGRKRKAVLE